jgi:hypothetical protein
MGALHTSLFPLQFCILISAFSRDNNPAFERCAEGLVFDPRQKICAWSDEALRPGCLVIIPSYTYEKYIQSKTTFILVILCFQPEDLLGFKCPNPKLSIEDAISQRVHLRFGDHDRCIFIYNMHLLLSISMTSECREISS